MLPAAAGNSAKATFWSGCSKRRLGLGPNVSALIINPCFATVIEFFRKSKRLQVAFGFDVLANDPSATTCRLAAGRR
ncbi:MAG: hypothetical protein RKL24_10380, partial [Defluviicoccus sp.]|nr:hypothetical protein [Defluviicoccus sp.]